MIKADVSSRRRSPVANTVPSLTSGALPHIPRSQSGPETADVPIEGHATKRLTTASQFYQDDEK